MIHTGSNGIISYLISYYYHIPLIVYATQTNGTSTTSHVSFQAPGDLCKECSYHRYLWKANAQNNWRISGSSQGHLNAETLRATLVQKNNKSYSYLIHKPYSRSCMNPVFNQIAIDPLPMMQDFLYRSVQYVGCQDLWPGNGPSGLHWQIEGCTEHPVPSIHLGNVQSAKPIETN